MEMQSQHQCFVSQAEKRAHHNALERKRRDHIKDSFTSLRESVPALQGEKAVGFTNIGYFGWVVRFQRIC
jgi:Max protein